MKEGSEEFMKTNLEYYINGLRESKESLLDIPCPDIVRTIRKEFPELECLDDNEVDFMWFVFSSDKFFASCLDIKEPYIGYFRTWLTEEFKMPEQSNEK